ncbi:MAG: peptidylprolyl isomerase [Pseudomonadota bacterium]
MFAALTITASAAGKANMLIMDLKSGRVIIELTPELAPKHVARIRKLANDGFYDGLKFHRVIEGFMAQTGDPQGTGAGGSDLADLDAEFTGERFERGVLGMARTSDPNSANSQFFIMLAAAPHLNGQYTVFGRVTEGMDAVDAIKKGSRAANGAVDDPDRIVRMRTADKL